MEKKCFDVEVNVCLRKLAHGAGDKWLCALRQQSCVIRHGRFAAILGWKFDMRFPNNNYDTDGYG